MGWIYLIRLAVATVLGILIGIERKIRIKEAGMRTHSIVSLGACLMVLISLYGFGDESDKSRVAAQIVSGIGFLGAGMIMFKEQSGLRGLTTAAGIWVTAGIGMAIGCGEYLLGCGATALIIFIQCILHLPFKILKSKQYFQLEVVCVNDDESIEKIKELFNVQSFNSIKVTRNDDCVLFKAKLTTDRFFDDVFLSKTMQTYPFIRSLGRIDYD